MCCRQQSSSDSEKRCSCGVQTRRQCSIPAASQQQCSSSIKAWQRRSGGGAGLDPSIRRLRPCLWPCFERLPRASTKNLSLTGCSHSCVLWRKANLSTRMKRFIPLIQTLPYVSKMKESQSFKIPETNVHSRRGLSDHVGESFLIRVDSFQK